MMLDTLRVGLVGAGWIARYHAQAVRACDGTALVAIADPDVPAARSLAAGTATVYDSYLQMSGSEQLDLVIVCTPPWTHADIACHFLAQGVHVLCEKPFATATSDAQRMVESASRSGAYLSLAAKYRFIPDVIAAREIMQSGKIGRWVAVDVAFTGQQDMAGRWQADSNLSGGGVFADNGPHGVDLVQFLAGPAQNVALSVPSEHRLAVEETAAALLELEDGVLARVFVSWALPRTGAYYASVYGTEGTVEIGWERSRWRKTGEPWQDFGSGYAIDVGIGGQIRDMLRSIIDKCAPSVGPTDAVRNVVVVEAAYRSVGGAPQQVILPTLNQPVR